MKKIFYLATLAILLAGTQAFQKNKNANAPKRIALIVAIADFKNQYKNEQWGHLSSLNDDTIITDALKKQGFTEFIRLRNSEATVVGIRKAFANLKSKINAGDIVYIHFSGHGQQVFDDNGDETDGLDECIVGYDAPMFYHEGYKGEKHLRDDELGKLVNEIRVVSGTKGNVLVVSDACHSGTALRGPVCRGTEAPMTPPGFDALKVRQVKDSAAENFLALAGGMSPVILFSACQAKETNQEYNHCGSLSLAITQALPLLKSGDSYNTLFAFINTKMATMNLGQTPMVEGSTKIGVFGGEVAKQSNYYTVRNIKTGIVVISGGTLNGLYVGSKVALMPAGSASYDPAKAVYNGTVSTAELGKAIVTVDKDLSKYKESQLWAFVTEQAFGSQKLYVGFGDGIGKNKNDIKNNVQKLEFIAFRDKLPDVIIDSKAGKYFLTLLDGRKPFEEMDSYEALNNQLNAFMQGKIMSEVNFKDPDIQVELSFIPSHFDGWDGDVPLITDVNMESRLNNGVMELIDNDVMSVKLKNTGMYDVYINMLEIAPNGKVYVCLPDFENATAPKEILLPAGKEYIVPNYYRSLGVGPGNIDCGKYIYKLFATRESISFSGIFLTRGAGSAETFTHPAAKLFGQSFNAKRAGGNLSTTKTSGGGTTSEYTIVLKPKK